MLLAAEHPFRKAIGIELNPALVRIARRNLTRWRTAGRAKTPTQMIHGDAIEAPLPAGPCLLFLFNPFGEAVIRRLIARIAKAYENRPGECDLLYVNNEQERVIERQAGFTRLYLGQVRRSRTDAIAEHRIMANQPDGEYAAANYEDCSIWRWNGRS